MSDPSDDRVGGVGSPRRLPPEPPTPLPAQNYSEYSRDYSTDWSNPDPVWWHNSNSASKPTRQDEDRFHREAILSSAAMDAQAIIARAHERAESIVAEAQNQAMAELHAARRQILELRAQTLQDPLATPAGRSRRPARLPAQHNRRRSWGRGVHRYRWPVIMISLVLTALAALWGPGVVGKLANGGFDVPGSESYATDRLISTTVGRPTPDIIALYRSENLTVDDAAFRSAVDAVVADLPKEGIRVVTSFWTTNSPAMVSTDRRATIVGIYLSGTEDERIGTYRTLTDDLQLDPAVASTKLGGVMAADAQISDQVAADLTKAETLSAPLLAILLIVVFGGLVAAGLPLLIGAVTVLGAFVILRLLLQVTEISVFAINIVTLLGLGLAIDYALLTVARFREELDRGHDPATALETTMRTAGRSIVVSAVIVSVSLAGLLFFPMVFLRSMAYGGMAVVGLAALVATTLLPAVLAVLGHRVNALGLPWRRSRKSGQRPERPGGLWARLATTVMRRPVLFILGVTTLLVAMAWPVQHVSFGGIDARQLPVSAPARQVSEALAADFPQVRTEPILVLLTGSSKTAVDELSTRVRAIEGVESVTVASAQGDQALLAVNYPGEAVDATARGIVEKIRALEPSGPGTLRVGGYSAQQVDLRSSIADGLWRMGLLVFAVTFLLLFLAFGSFVVAIKAILITLATIVASLGVVVLIFQDGYGADLLGFVPTGSVELTQPILVTAILFGLTTDYEIFLISRIREYWDRLGDNEEAVARGLQRTGPIITSAAGLILVVIAAFSTSQITFIKLIGVGMAVSILLDATVMRALLVPATMRLLGRWNWWAPAPLARWWQRHRLEPVESQDEREFTPHGSP